MNAGQKLLVLAAGAASAFLYKKWKNAEAEKSVWSRSTDKVD